MLNNYKKLENGIIKQIYVEKFDYDKNYVLKYNNYGDNNIKLSFLRLGAIIGSLGKIPTSILDVGCGNGSFLSACSQIIKDCYGYDVVDYKLPNNINKVDNIFNKKYEVITFFDSLEHFEDINCLKDLKCDYICVSVPWCHYTSDEWFKKWKHRRENEHIWHFNEISLKNFFEELNFELINYTNFEDSIRKNNSEENNILTALFKRKEIT